MSKSEYSKLVFPDSFDEAWQADVLSKKYFALARAEGLDGSQYPVFFISLYGLTQELEDTMQKLEQSWFAEPGLIVLRDFTYENMANAVRSLWDEGFFDNLKPVSSAG
ncbi:MAG: hypothetical protein IVW51_16495 [Thermaceae bacterium]|nr:hypothetical protein [Thermaceae bacterium]